MLGSAGGSHPNYANAENPEELEIENLVDYDNTTPAPPEAFANVGWQAGGPGQYQVVWDGNYADHPFTTYICTIGGVSYDLAPFDLQHTCALGSFTAEQIGDGQDVIIRGYNEHGDVLTEFDDFLEFSE